MRLGIKREIVIARHFEEKWTFLNNQEIVALVNSHQDSPHTKVSGN